MHEFEAALLQLALSMGLEPGQVGALRLVAELVNDSWASKRIHKNLDEALDQLKEHQVSHVADIAPGQVCTHPSNRDGNILFSTVPTA